MKYALIVFFYFTSFSLWSDCKISGTVFTKAKIKEHFSTRAGIDLKIGLENERHEVNSEIILEKENYFNYGGISSATIPFLTLKKAFYKVNLFTHYPITTHIKVGRFPLQDEFPSYVNFNLDVDGVVTTWKTNLDRKFNAYLKGIIFLHDQEWKIRTSHLKNLSGGVQIGAANIGKENFYSSLSFFNWNLAPYEKAGRCYTEYLTIQSIIGYKNEKILFGYPCEIFVSYMINILEKWKEAHASYVGIIMGNDQKKGNFMLEAVYKWLHKKVIPNFDLKGLIDLPLGGNGAILRAKYMLTDSVFAEATWEAMRKERGLGSEFEQVWELKTGCLF